MTKRMGLALQTTEDLILNDNDQPFKLKRFNNNILVVARRNIWEQNKAQLAYRIANKDYKVRGKFGIQGYIAKFYAF